MHIHHTQAHELIFERSRSRLHGNRKRQVALLSKTTLRQASLALITHLFTFLSLICLNPGNSAVAVILAALKLATSLYQHQRTISSNDDWLSPP